MLIAILILSLLVPSEISWSDYVDKYNSTGNEQALSAESVWAMSVLYYSSPDDIQEKILGRIKTSMIREKLETNGDLKSYITDINEDLLDESLLLLNLLLEVDEKIRNKLFDDFYSKNHIRKIYLLNEHAKKGEDIEIDSIDIRDFQFHHFLLAFYINTNNIVTTEYFEKFSSYWIEKASEKMFDKMTEDFLYATITMSSYQVRDYNNLVFIYDRIKEINYIPPSSLKRSIFWGIDFAMYRAGKIDKSLEIQRNYTIPISEYLNDQSTITSIYASMGGYLYMLGKYQDARGVFLSALENSDQLSDDILTRLYNNLSLIYFNTGESFRYIEMQLKALDHANKLQNYSHQIQIYRNLHIFYRKNRNWDLAESYIEQASKLAIEKGHQSDLVSIYISQAVFEDRYLGNSEAAYEKLRSAKSSYNEDVDPRYMIRILVEQADLLMKDQKWNESKYLLDEAKNLSAEYSNSTAFLEILVKLAFVEYNKNQLMESGQFLQEFRAHDVTVVDFPILVLAQTLQAQLLVNKGYHAEAQTLLASASERVLERAYNTSETETGYWSVEPEYMNLFEIYTDFLISRGRHHEALVLLDRVKTINDASLVENPLIKSSVLSEEELAMERQIVEDMDRIRKQLFNASADEQLALQNELESLSAQKRELNRNLKITHRQDPPKIWRIQRSLKTGQQVLHITELEENYYLSHISRNSVEVIKIHLSDEIADVFENAVASVVRGRTNLDYLYQAGQFINIHSLPANTRSVLVIPDGFFHQLPLDIIPLDKPGSPFSYGSARYVVEEMDVRHLNSLKDLMPVNRPDPASYAFDYTGFGISDFQNRQDSRSLVSLPKAPIEVENISESLYRFSKKNSFINEVATPVQFRQSAGQSRILHMATHSEVSESDPLFSRLHLSEDPESASEGQPSDHLFAYELFDLNMQNQLIMLNSCDSGGDRNLQGSGIMGISRALRYAGAQSLVLNAWSVNDHFAADFAEKFYTYLNEGESKSRALQLTKIYFIKEKNANPHYWGPYVLNGDNRPLLAREDSQSGMFILAGIFLIGFIALRRDFAKTGKAA